MPALEEKSFDTIARECELIIEDLEDEIERQERWQEVLDNGRSNPSVPDL